MKNSIFVLIMISTLFFSSCGNQGTTQEMIQNVCKESQNICGLTTDLCKMYNITEACNIVNEVCYYTNMICTNVINSKDREKLERTVSEMKILKNSIETMKTNYSTESPVTVESYDKGQIDNILNQLVIIEQRFAE